MIVSHGYIPRAKLHLDGWVVNLEESWSSNDGRIINSRSTVGQDDVSLTSKSRWNGSGVSVARLRDWLDDWAIDGWEGSVEGLSLSLEALLWLNLDGGAGDDGLSVQEVEKRELRDTAELGGITFWARNDITGRNRISLRWSQRDIERTWERRLLRRWDLSSIGKERACVAEISGVAGLNSEDRASCENGVLVLEETGAAEVGADSDALDASREVEEGRWVGGWEDVLAWLDGVASEGALEVGDVDGLLGREGCDVVDEGLGCVSAWRYCMGRKREEVVTAGRPAS